MDELKMVWKKSLNIDIHKASNNMQMQIITFVYNGLLKNNVNPAHIDFMGTVYSKNHISVRVPSLMEMAIGRFYDDGFGKQDNEASQAGSLQDKFQSWQPSNEKVVDKARYLSISPQRLNLVDGRSEGLEKLAKAFTAFNGCSGLFCWHGDLEFEIMIVSSKK